MTNGHTQSCGCLAKKISRKRQKIIKYIPEMKKWECQCKCGNICYVSQNNLTRENGTKSCGCLISLTRANEANIVQGTNVGNIKRNTALPNSTTGIKGVHYSKTQGLYIATIGFQGKQYYLVSSTDINICINARKDAEKQIYGNFLEWYENRKKIGITNHIRLVIPKCLLVNNINKYLCVKFCQIICLKFSYGLFVFSNLCVRLKEIS